MKQKYFSAAWAALWLLAAVSGCGQQGPKLGAVQGTVTLNGKPVPYAYVLFQPTEPPGTYGSAYADANGKYSLRYTRSQRGAPVGRHSVTVRTPKREELALDEDVDDQNAGKAAALKMPDGVRENLRAEFEREVKPGRNQHDFDLGQTELSQK